MVFSTRTLPPAERHAAWRRGLASHCAFFSTEPHSGEFEGSLEVRQVGDLRCSRIAQSPGRAYRSESEIRRKPVAKHILVLQLEGGSTMEQAGRAVSLSAGDLTMIDMMKPSLFSFATRSVQLSVHLAFPRDGATTEWDGRLATPLPAAAGVLVGTLVSAAYASAYNAPLRGPALRQSLVTLLRAGWALEAPAPAQASSALERVQAYISGNLHDHLEAAVVAGANGMSERTLHRLFAAAGTRFGTWLRQARLDGCAQALANADLSDRNVTEIAFAYGFNNSAHFSRVFRDRFGMTPSEHRSGRAGRLIDRIS